MRDKLANGLGPIKKKRASLQTLTKVDDELDDLKAGNPLLPPAPDTPRALEVIPVHYYVDSQVQGDDHPRHRRATEELGVAENSRGAVVVAVKEGCETNRVSKIWQGNTEGSLVWSFKKKRTQRLLLQEEEDSVEELQILGQVVELELTCAISFSVSGVYRVAWRMA